MRGRHAQQRRGCWLLGRALFWIGYHKNPLLRAFGFGLTFYPTVIIIVWLLVKVLGSCRISDQKSSMRGMSGSIRFHAQMIQPTNEYCFW